ncbi:hypothetical protein JTB14_027616 [Gonioctena quinquepunctata]|nr:hypothetical protein JTB14_027616 [Gonioctena quinquepunctata]
MLEMKKRINSNVKTRRCFEYALESMLNPLDKNTDRPSCYDIGKYDSLNMSYPVELVPKNIEMYENFSKHYLNINEFSDTTIELFYKSENLKSDNHVNHVVGIKKMGALLSGQIHNRDKLMHICEAEYFNKLQKYEKTIEFLKNHATCQISKGHGSPVNQSLLTGGYCGYTTVEMGVVQTQIIQQPAPGTSQEAAKHQPRSRQPQVKNPPGTSQRRLAQVNNPPGTRMQSARHKNAIRQAQEYDSPGTRMQSARQKNPERNNFCKKIHI